MATIHPDLFEAMVKCVIEAVKAENQSPPIEDTKLMGITLNDDGDLSSKWYRRDVSMTWTIPIPRETITRGLQKWSGDEK